MRVVRFNPALHWLAVLTAMATFPLIFMGGLVTSHQAGMSVPDWPNSYGYNMFLFPPRLWIGGILYEHTHRLMGTVVGMLSIALTIAAWKLESRRWVRWLCAATLGAVILQGILGGLRVVWVNLNLAVVHACFAQAFFCLTALVVAVTSKWWLNSQSGRGFQPVGLSAGGDGGQRPPYGLPATAKLALLAVGLIYSQLIVGALMRHYRAGLAIPDLPLAYGKVLPPTDAAGLDAVNQSRAWDSQHNLDPVTLGQIWLHFGHRIGAILVAAALGWLIVHVLRRDEPLLRRPAILLIFMLLAQLTLGVLVVLWRKPADLTSAHVAIGALTLFTTFTVAIRSMRLGEQTMPVLGAGYQPMTMPAGTVGGVA